jgi:hypothetical protein
MTVSTTRGPLTSTAAIVATALALLAGAKLAAGEPPTFVYQTTVTGFNSGAGSDLVVDDGGNAYVLAGDRDDDGVHLGLAVVKVGPAGDVLWVTPISGSDHDGAGGIALNSAGEVCLCGFTDSADFPMVNALDDTLTGFRDAFVMKLSAENGSITYSTYLGGDYVDWGYDIVVTSSDEMIVVGTTESSDFPTVDPIQAELNSAPYQYADLFITRLSADGSEILYSTYLGGSQDERAAAVALDAQERIYVATNVEHDDFPTVNPIQGFAGGLEDVVVARLSADGSAIEFATYLGGSDWDHVGRIDVDSDGSVYLAGSTRSIDYPTTPGAYQEEFVGEILGCGSPPFDPLRNCEDVFVTKLSRDGSAFEYSTFLAGHTVDEARHISVDGFGRAHVAGYTFSSEFPGAGPGEVFLTRLDATGSAVDYTVALDSVTPNAAQAVAVDEQGGVYFTASVDLPSQVYIAKYQGDLPQLPGDLNGDCDVDLGDLAILLSNYAVTDGAQHADGDLDGDGDVDLADLSALLAVYGTRCD